MADIPGDVGEGLDIRQLISGTDVVGIYPSGLFAGSFALTNTGSVIIASSNLIGVSGLIFTEGDLTGSVSLQGVGSIYVTNFEGGGYTGSRNWIIDTAPDDGDRNNPLYKMEYIISGTATGVFGSSVGSVTMFVGAGSYVSVLEYSNNLVEIVGSYV